MAGWTLEQLEALEDAIAKGVRRVEYRDKQIEYRSLKEMMQLRSQMRKCLGLDKCHGKVFIKTSKGVC